MCRTQPHRLPSSASCLRGKPKFAAQKFQKSPTPTQNSGLDFEQQQDQFQFPVYQEKQFCQEEHIEQSQPEEENEFDSTKPRSTVCAVCSIDTGSFNLNYGANTCLSCRAFFRRAIQKTRNPKLICK